MKKRILSCLLALSMLSVPALAAESGTENLVRSKTYTGQFSDLPEDHTFYKNVAALYEYGLSVGQDDGTFGLTAPMTVGQTVIFAGRIRSLYRTGDPEAGPAAFAAAAVSQKDAWRVYAPYLWYLQSEGVLDKALDDCLTQPATRAQMAHVLANLLPEEALPLINDSLVTQGYASRRRITDVTEYTPYYQDILKLYRCGVSIGSNAAGSFFPDAPITRGAAAAMLTRIVDPALRPELAILDPALLEALPPRLIAESGMDAVSHCVEAAAAREASPVTDALAHSACRTLLRLLPRSFAGETAVRRDVHLAASMAALAFDNAGLGACHALAHALGGRFHVAHGRLCAMLLPHVIAHHAAADPHPYAALAAACGLPGVRGLTGAIVRLRARLGLPASLPEAGVPREAVLEAETDVLEAALEDPCAAQAPAPLTHDALQALLRQVL